MEDELDAVTPTVEALSGESETSTTETEMDDLLQLDTEGTPTDEEEEVEYEGQKYKIPAALKGGFLRQADYTQKTMALSEEKKTIESLRAETEEARAISLAKVEATAQAKAIELAIKELSETPVNGLPQETIAQLQMRLAHLQSEHVRVSSDANQLTEIEAKRYSEEMEKARTAAVTEAAKVIPNFSDTRRGELEALAVNLGVSKDDAQTITDPSAYRILHLADIGQKFLDRQRATKTVENAQAASGVPQVGGKSTAAKDPNRMSTDEWMKWRASKSKS